MRTYPTLLAIALAGVTILAACGDDDDAGDGATTAPAPATPADTAAPTAPPASQPAAPGTTPGSTPEGAGTPQAIVSIAPTATEMLFAIGAGDQVIAVDDQSNHPAEAAAKMTDLSGYEPNVEAIAGYEPDLVVASDDTVKAQLEALGIPVWVGPAATTFEDTYEQLEQLGAATGHVAEAAELVAQMQSDIDEIAASVPPTETPLTVYHELSADGFSANSSTFIGQVYSRLGLQNIADLAEGDHGGYPQLNAESIVTADPDLIFLADTKCCGESLETVAARPGWQGITAVANGDVFEMDDDVASRWGPRVVDYMREVADAVNQAVTAPAGG
jgi:iron complex transport system substrate-binding protein